MVCHSHQYDQTMSSSLPHRLLIILAVALLTLALGGCGSLGYYRQAVSGHWALMTAQRPLAEVLADPATPAATRLKLQLAQAAREYASARLALPANDSYTAYVALDRRYVVWNVFAAPPLALDLKESCFLFVGCLSYRGYFSEQAAQAAGARLRDAGFDVFVGGVAAYSTLGWFADPVLSSMLHWEDAVLARMLFHELAHQRLYVKGDTAFNESFATAVADAGFARWRAETPLGAAIAAVESHQDAFIGLLLEYRQKLAVLYRETVPDADKLTRKAALFQALRDEFTTMSRTWSDREDYARWLASDLNNAKIASIQAYHKFVPAFTTLLAHRGGDFARFYAAADELGKWPRAQRHTCLRALPASPALPAACAGLAGHVAP